MAVMAASTRGDVIVAMAVLAGAALALIVAWVLIRRVWRRAGEASRAAPDWSLQQLRELRAAGQITEEEFARLREQIVRQARGAAPTEPASVSASQRPDSGKNRRGG